MSYPTFEKSRRRRRALLSGAKIKLPLDAVTGITWQAAGSYYKSLTNNWLNGNLFDVLVGATNTTIKAINGSLDISSLSTTLGSNVGYITKTYDQSGAGNDFTQTSANNRSAVFMSNGKPIFVSDGFTQLEFSNDPKYLTMPVGVALNNNSGTYFFVHKQSNSAPADTTFGPLYNVFMSAGTVGGHILFQGPGLGGGNFYGVFNTANPSVDYTNIVPETQPLVSSFTLTASGWSIGQNEISQTITTPLVAGTSTGGQLGCWTSDGGGADNGYYGQMFGWMLSANILTAPQQTAIRNSLYSLFGIYPTPTTSLLFDGASVVEGFGAIPDPATDGVWGAGYGFVDQTLTALNNIPLRIGNTGEAGATLATLNTSYASKGHLFFTSAPVGKKILVAGGFAVHNSFGAGRTAAQAFSDLQTYITTVKADAWDKIFVFTDYEGGTFLSAAQAYNALVITNAASLGVTVIDVATAAASTLTANWGGGTPYYNDVSNQHPSLIGHTQIATPTISALSPFIS